MLVIFWLSAAVLFYVFVGYPLLLALWARTGDRRIHAGPCEPAVSVLIVARNEQDTIRRKLMDLLAMDYPRDKLQIVVASDGSSDATDAIVREFAPQGVILKSSPQARGKPANLNDCIPALSGEVVVLMDARQRVGNDAVRALVQNFSDPRIGAVSGELMLAPVTVGSDTSVGNGVGFYWRYEKFMRRAESTIDSSVGATGALYAIRRSLFRPIAPDTLLDDMLIPMNVVRQGYRVIFENGAVVQEVATVTAGNEFRRKVRTIAGNFQVFAREPWLLNPRQNRIWLQTLSHKVGRLLAPLFLLLLLFSNTLLLTQSFYQFTLAAQLMFYSAALLACMSELGGNSTSRWKGARALAVPYAFCVLNWATVIGFTRFVFKRQIRWKQ